MCGLYGFVNYSNDKIKNLSDLTNSLAEQSAVRGTDATGIAFTSSGGINIIKDSKSAYRMNFKHSDDIVALIGHTRHSTQGSEKKNYNNHPFSGKCNNTRFALAHNGVLTNEKELKQKYKLPKTRIETDSFVAALLVESRGFLDFDSIKYMAERTEGSFSYSILDDKNNIWLVKGDSPLSILHFPKLKMYVYASTDEILYKALVDYQPLFKALKSGEFEEIEISEGDILKICSNGDLEKSKFDYSYYCVRNWWDFGIKPYHSSVITQDSYIEDLKSIACYQGFSKETIDDLLNNGFTLEEIEDYIYEF